MDIAASTSMSTVVVDPAGVNGVAGVVLVTSEAQASPGGELAVVEESSSEKWPGWPGDCVFRMIVPVNKVGGIIGRKGEMIKKLCEDTKARVRVLEPPLGTTDRIVLISGKEETDLPLSPAMDAFMKIFKRVNGIEDEHESKQNGFPKVAHCSVRLLVASTQAISLIGKQGTAIKTIQHGTGSSVRVLSESEAPLYTASDEKVIELLGDAVKVYKALEAVLGHLRKFLVDHSVIPLFEKNYSNPTTQEHQVDLWTEKQLHTTSQYGVGGDYPVLARREAVYLDHKSQLGQQYPSPGVSLYGSHSGVSGIRSSGINHFGIPIVTQVTKTMKIPISYAEDIIGLAGNNIAYIRQTSGAVLTVQESLGLPDEISVEIKGMSSQVQIAQRLIQDFISNHKHKEPFLTEYGNLDRDLRFSYSQQMSYLPSLLAEPYGGYGTPGIPGRYAPSGNSDINSTFRL